MDQLEDDYSLLDDLLNQGEDVQLLEVDPVTLETQKSSGPVDLTLEPEQYEVLEEEGDEVPLADRLGAKKKGAERKRKAKSAPASSAVTLTGKSVRDQAEQDAGSKRVRIASGSSAVVTAGLGFGALAPPVPELPRVRLNRILDEAGMADERFVRRMVEDLKDAGTDLFIANNATPKENRARLLAQGMRVSLYTLKVLRCLSSPYDLRRMCPGSSCTRSTW